MSLKRKPGGERRRRFSPLLWMTSLAAIAVLALGITGTLSQFVASITNTQNRVQTVGPNAFVWSEYLVTGEGEEELCVTVSAGQNVNCNEINKNGQFGQVVPTPIAPGQTRTTTVRLANESGVGGLSGNINLRVDPCTQEPPVGTANPANGGVAAGDLCGTATITVNCTDGSEFTTGPVTLTAFAAGSASAGPNGYLIASAVPPEGDVFCTFTTSLPAGATAVNLQAITTDQPMTWTFTQSA